MYTASLGVLRFDSVSSGFLRDFDGIAIATIPPNEAAPMTLRHLGILALLLLLPSACSQRNLQDASLVDSDIAISFSAPTLEDINNILAEVTDSKGKQVNPTLIFVRDLTQKDGLATMTFKFKIKPGETYQLLISKYTFLLHDLGIYTSEQIMGAFGTFNFDCDKNECSNPLY